MWKFLLGGSADITTTAISDLFHFASIWYMRYHCEFCANIELSNNGRQERGATFISNTTPTNAGCIDKFRCNTDAGNDSRGKFRPRVLFQQNDDCGYRCMSNLPS
jgi:hypothetical protein